MEGLNHFIDTPLEMSTVKHKVPGFCSLGTRHDRNTVNPKVARCHHEDIHVSCRGPEEELEGGSSTPTSRHDLEWNGWLSNVETQFCIVPCLNYSILQTDRRQDYASNHMHMYCCLSGEKDGETIQDPSRVRPTRVRVTIGWGVPVVS